MVALQQLAPANPAEALTISQWARILGKTTKAIRLRHIPKGGTTVDGGKLVALFRYQDLPLDYRSDIDASRERHGVTHARDLLGIAACEQRKWKAKKGIKELIPEAQIRAEHIRSVMVSYYGWLDQGQTQRDAVQRAQVAWYQTFKKPCSEKTIRNWEARIEERGGIEFAPSAAFADGRNGVKRQRGAEFPPDFEAWFRAQFLDSTKGIPGLGTIYNHVTNKWLAGIEVPGLGIRQDHEHFPWTKHQLRRLVPSRASREIVGRGKFLSKVGGYSSAMPLDWTDVEPIRFVLFDDKMVDIQIQNDEGTRTFRPVIYIAMCGGTRRILSYIAREEGRMTQLDVEGLQAAVLRDHGFGGQSVGWVSAWIKERGTVSISTERKHLLESLWPGCLDIQQTMMIGGRSAPGEYQQKASGNFFGKGILESFMGSFDHDGKILPGATGNHYSVQPSTLGDTTLTLDNIINSAKGGHKAHRSLIEEGLSTSAIARVLDYMETGESVSAYEAAKRQGIKPPVLFFSDFVALLGEIFRAYNHRRGHRMQGFAKIRVPHPNRPDEFITVTESPMDKSARMFTAMATQGRTISRPSDIDIAAILHKVKRVRITANGVSTEGRTYWSPTSAAVRAATSIQGADTIRLALYNPVAPDALYLLANPPGHLPASATQIPEGFIPQLAEVLPMYQGAAPDDPAAMRKRAEHVAAQHARTTREILVASAPILAERTAVRQELSDRMEPLRATIRSAAPETPPNVLPPTVFAQAMAAGEDETNDAATRAAQREQALPSYAARLAARARERELESHTQNPTA